MKKRDSGGIGSTSPDMRLASVVPESDPAYPVIAAILRVVPASRWAFARVQAGGELGFLLASHGNDGDLSWLENEFGRQREKAKIGARIATTLGPLGDFESGITLLFADAHADFGILTLLRTSADEPFTSSEISVLALSLDATSERLAALRRNQPEVVQEVSPSAHDRTNDGLDWTLPTRRNRFTSSTAICKSFWHGRP